MKRDIFLKGMKVGRQVEKHLKYPEREGKCPGIHKTESGLFPLKYLTPGKTH